MDVRTKREIVRSFMSGRPLTFIVRLYTSRRVLIDYEGLGDILRDYMNGRFKLEVAKRKARVG